MTKIYADSFPGHSPNPHMQRSRYLLVTMTIVLTAGLALPDSARAQGP